MRRVDWGALEPHELSIEGISPKKSISKTTDSVPSAVDFIHQLLQERPSRRMSLTNALHHEWLRQHFPFHGVTQPDEIATDAPMMHDEPEYPEQYIAVDTSANAGNARRPGRLVRRHVLEEEDNLPELSAEMIAYATARDGHSGAAPAKGLNKRMHAELTPLQEEVNDDARTEGAATPVEETRVAAAVEVVEDDRSDNNPPRRSSRRTKVARRD